MLDKILIERKKHKENIARAGRGVDRYGDYFLSIRTELMLNLLSELGVEKPEIKSTKIGSSIVAVTATIPVDDESLSIHWTGQNLSLSYRNQSVICPDPWLNKYWIAQTICELIA